ncbi:MAG: NAD-dependent epimerase/dehydratase family protein [Gammaproteobacteria bacterium]
MTDGLPASSLVALTGATGFVGGVIARHLHAQGHQLRLLARSPDRIPKGLNAQLVPGSLADSRALESLVTGVDAVVHCAGLTRAARLTHFEEVNAAGTQRLAQQAIATGNPPFLLISSLAAREPQVSAYAQSKRQAEEILAAMPDLHWAAFRPPAVYGPGSAEVVGMLRWMDRGLAFSPGSPQARFSVVHADDIATAVSAWLADSSITGIFDIDDQQEGGYSWIEFVAVAQSVLGRSVSLRPAPPRLLNAVAWIGQQLGNGLGIVPALTPDKLAQLRHPDWVCRDRSFSARTAWRPAISLQQGLAAIKSGW